MLKLADIKEARERIGSYVLRTPLLRQSALDELLGCEVYLKHEGLQVSGSFKIRGATNKILTLTPEELGRGVVSASSGNHAMGVAYAARRAGTQATIVMPENANPVKLAGVRGYGATVMQVGTLSSQREDAVRQFAEEKGMIEVHPYADPYVAAGQGTIGLEVLEDLPDMDVIVVPIGGGGLISGVSTAIKETSSKIRVVGAEPAACPRYALSRKQGKSISMDSVGETIADGTRTNRADPKNFEMIEARVDDFCAVEDEWIIKAMKAVVSNAKIVAEPSSVMGVAAALSGALSGLSGKKVCFLLSGGNNDLKQLAKIIGA